MTDQDATGESDTERETNEDGERTPETEAGEEPVGSDTEGEKETEGGAESDVDADTAAETTDENMSDVDEAPTDAERIAELETQLARKQADFENFKKRLNRRRAEERERATEDLVTRLLGVRDDLARALDQEGDADIRGGVDSTLTEFDRVLEDEGVDEIVPDPGTEVDPSRHEVMLRVDSDEPEDRIAEVFRLGYEMGGKVLRPAQVTVSDGTASDAE
jgi:molecular chaperone GrpE